MSEPCATCGHERRRHWEAAHTCNDWGQDGRACPCRSFTSRPEELKSALEEAEAELAAVYRRLWPLREQYAETFPPAELPAPRYRTDKQNAVARCPRCGGKLEEEKEIVHGNWGYSRHGCRCEICTAANTEKSRAARARKESEGPPRNE